MTRKKTHYLVLIVILIILFIWRLGYKLHKAEFIFYGLGLLFLVDLGVKKHKSDSEI